MKIESIHLRRFRGYQKASLDHCSGLNVLIGRNNSGKSTALAAIELAIGTIKQAKISSELLTRSNPEDEFTNRDTTTRIQIGIRFSIEPSFNQSLREKLLSDSAGLERAIDQLAGETQISIIIAVEMSEGLPIIYVESMGLAPIDASGDNLIISAKLLASLSSATASELANRERDLKVLRHDANAIDRIDSSMIEYTYRETPRSPRRSVDIGLRESLSSENSAKLNEIYRQSSSADEFMSGASQLKSLIELEITEIEKTPLESQFSVFSGTVKIIPHYVSWALNSIADGTIISFKEIRPAIGRDEAGQLLRLKTRRGGAEALARIQKTVRALLGVTVDAFEAESSPIARRGSGRVPTAEMDIDEFLVEANGAGIREALRIILDIELRSPDLVFIEEPEVHLHPGLEKTLHGYLADKSKTVQMFVATHSANFIDKSSRQNIYLVSRKTLGEARIQKVASEGDLLKIGEEVGLRPSTVLMFDRIVFVEGPSDEDIIRAFCKTLEIDPSSSNTAFVQMGGASRFAHYAAQATVDLLSRRQVEILFLIDRDERDTDDVKQLIDKLGGQAQAAILSKRELENYLLSPTAIKALAEEKLQTSGNSKADITIKDISDAIAEAANGLLEESINLRVSAKLLRPLYANHGGDGIPEKLSAMKAALDSRLQELPEIESSTRQDLTRVWSSKAAALAPGSLVLDAVLSKFGLRYRKVADGGRLAEYMKREEIEPEVVELLRKIGRR